MNIEELEKKLIERNKCCESTTYYGHQLSEFSNRGLIAIINDMGQASIKHRQDHARMNDFTHDLYEHGKKIGNIKDVSISPDDSL